MSSSCKILICLVQNACRKKCCLLIQHVTLIFMFALIKYIFDCLWLVSQIFFNSYLLHPVDKQTGNLSLFSDHLLIKILPTPILFFTHNNLRFLVRAKITKKTSPSVTAEWWSMISTGLSSIARTLTMLTVAKKCVYYRVKVIFLHHKVISNKTSKVLGNADFWFAGLVTTGSILPRNSSVDFHSHRIKLQHSWPPRQWSPHHPTDSHTWFRQSEHFTCF